MGFTFYKTHDEIQETEGFTVKECLALLPYRSEITVLIPGGSGWSLFMEFAGSPCV